MKRENKKKSNLEMLFSEVINIEQIIFIYNEERKKECEKEREINESNIELEFRFGKFKNRNFKSGIDSELFNELIKEYLSCNHYSDCEYKETIEIKCNSGIKIIKTENGEEQYIRKNKMKVFDIENYNLRLSLMREEKIANINLNEEIPVFSRHKKRWSFMHKNKNYRLDLSIVHNTNILTKIRNTSFEVEVEFLTEKLDTKILFEPVENLLLIIYNKME